MDWIHVLGEGSVAAVLKKYGEFLGYLNGW